MKTPHPNTLAVLAAIEKNPGLTAHELYDQHLTGVDGRLSLNSIFTVTKNLRNQGKIHSKRKGLRSAWYLGPKEQKEWDGKVRVAPPKPVPMPEHMTRQLNLKIHQKERAISFDVEGWNIKIGFGD